MLSKSLPRFSSLLKSRSIRARFGLALLVALAVHLPATPLMRVFGFFSTLIDLRNAERYEYDAGAVTISVELAEPPTPKPSRDNVRAVTMETPGEPPASDPVKLPRAHESPPPEPDKTAAQPAAEASAKPAHKGPKEPPGISGEISKSLQGKPNVTLSVWPSSIRSHPLGESTRPLLSCGPLGAALIRSGIDPLQDVDAVMFAGPRIQDPAKFTVAVQHTMSPQALHQAVDKLVRGRGGWIDPGAARVRIASANRVIFEHGPRLVFAAPEQGWEQIRAIKTPLSIPEGRGRALSVNLVHPALPLRKMGMRLPDSLREMHMDVYVSISGDCEVQVEFEDADEPSARRHAASINLQVRDLLWQIQRVSNLATMLSSGPSMDIELPELQLVADERNVVGKATLTRTQAAALLARIAAMVCSPSKTPASMSSSSAAASASGAPPVWSDSAPSGSR
jgi:hypothetical protein